MTLREDDQDSVEVALRSCLERAGYVWVQIEPMAEGKSNWLFEVRLEDGRVVVARISKYKNGKFEMERALMAAASLRGIPTPVVVDVVRESGGPPILLTTYLVGTPLDKLVRNLDSVELSGAASEIGRTLAKIHMLDLGTGYGNLDDSMQGNADSFVDWFIGDLERMVTRVKERLDRDTAAGLERAVGFITEQRSLLTDNDPVLLHGDFRPGNLMFDHLELVGVIDWEAAKRGPAALDFAWWDWSRRQSDVPIGSEDLIGGYQEVRPLESSTFAVLTAVAHARITIGYLDWAIRTRNTELKGTAQLALRTFTPQN